MGKRTGYSIAVIALGLVCAPGAPLLSAQEAFYKGKTIRIVVATAPGGGFDTYTRVIARHMGRHIPGNPTMIVENMPGAGHRIGANHVYKVAKPDGLTIGHFQGGLFLGHFWGKGGLNLTRRTLSSSAPR